MVIAKALWLFNIWQEYLENLVISVMWALGKVGNSRDANHMSLKFRSNLPLYIWVHLSLAKQALLFLKGKSTETYLTEKAAKVGCTSKARKTNIWSYKCKWIKSTWMKIPLKYIQLYEICIGFLLAWHSRKLIWYDWNIKNVARFNGSSDLCWKNGILLQGRILVVERASVHFFLWALQL